MRLSTILIILGLLFLFIGLYVHFKRKKKPAPTEKRQESGYSDEKVKSLSDVALWQLYCYCLEEGLDYENVFEEVRLRGLLDNDKFWQSHHVY